MSHAVYYGRGSSKAAGQPQMSIVNRYQLPEGPTDGRTPDRFKTLTAYYAVITLLFT